MPNPGHCQNPECKHSYTLHTHRGKGCNVSNQRVACPCTCYVAAAKKAKRPTPLTAAHYAAMHAVYWGGDVLCHACAKLLRAVALRHPQWLSIGPLGNAYGPKDSLPYFGATLLPPGRRALGRYTGTVKPSHTHQEV